MIGLVIAFLMAGFYLLTGTDQVKTFQDCTQFLLVWHCVFATIAALLMLGLALFGLGIGTLAGASHGGLLGSLVGSAIGSGLGLFGLFLFSIKQICLIGGIYLTMQALTLTNGQPIWDSTKLVVGGILYLLGFLMARVHLSASDD